MTAKKPAASASPKSIKREVVTQSQLHDLSMDGLLECPRGASPTTNTQMEQAGAALLHKTV